MLTTVRITAEDIANGWRRDPFWSPAAIAARRVVRDDVRVEVDGRSGSLKLVERSAPGSPEPTPVLVRLPVLATDWLGCFDNDLPVLPNSFAIWIPEEFLRRPGEPVQSVPGG